MRRSRQIERRQIPHPTPHGRLRWRAAFHAIALAVPGMTYKSTRFVIASISIEGNCQNLITMLTMFGELAVPLLCIGRNAPAPWLRASSGSTKFAPETSTSRLHLILPWRDLTSLPICYNTCHVCSAPSYMVAPESASQVGRGGRKVGLALKAMRNYQKAHATLCPNTNQINNI